MLKTLVFFVLTFYSWMAISAQQVKLAVLVPEGTSWGKGLKQFSKEVETITNGEVIFKIYYGGVSGDEPDVLRKIRIGQLHGGIFTGKTLGDIHGDLRAMEIPFTFYDQQDKASKALVKMTPEFNSGLKAKGFINLGFYEVGQVYLVSSKKVGSLSDLKGIKIWSWEGDPLVGAMIESLNLVSVPLALPDVLSSLSTGIIDAAYAPPLAILALQWHSKVKYLVDFPTAFSIGALLVSDKVWAKIKPDHQQKILSLANKFVTESNQKSMAENGQAKEQLKKMGIQFVSFPQADYQQAAGTRSAVIAKIKGKYVSSKAIEAVDKEVKK
jgi:TRAP-type transport system periplasmic protein